MTYTITFPTENYSIAAASAISSVFRLSVETIEMDALLPLTRIKVTGAAKNIWKAEEKLNEGRA